MNKSVDEILVENGLDFDIVKTPLVGNVDGVIVESPYYGLLNTKSGEIIHSVKKGYTPSQNREIVTAVLEGMKPFGDMLSVNMAGSLNGGKRVFIQLGIEGDAKVGDDTVKKNITIIDSNDGSTGLSVGVGDLTISCANQFFQFYKAGMKFRHTSSIEEKIKNIPKSIEEALANSMRLIETYKQMASSPLTRGLADQLVRHLVGIDRLASMNEIAELSGKKKNAMDTLHDMIKIEVDQKGDNLWGLHSGVTRWTTHKKSAPVRENGRIESAMLSTNYKTNQDSLNFVMEHM